ncbi:MAG: hypothetical protein MZU95_09595 [Desulfomicrobium escambiense]|nr:hypothetical protein [Desulfomicrobium escambiense]
MMEAYRHPLKAASPMAATEPPGASALRRQLTREILRHGELLDGDCAVLDQDDALTVGPARNMDDVDSRLYHLQGEPAPTEQLHTVFVSGEKADITMRPDEGIRWYRSADLRRR